MRNKPFKLHPLIHSATLIEDLLRVELKPIGIGPRKARVMNVLYLMGSASQGELAREFGITRASMSTMTSRLIAGGFITRKVDEDGQRRVKLKLTAKGTALIEQINETWRKVDRIMEESIGKEKAHQLATLSGKLRNALGGWVAGADTGYMYYGRKQTKEPKE